MYNIHMYVCMYMTRVRTGRVPLQQRLDGEEAVEEVDGALAGRDCVGG